MSDEVPVLMIVHALITDPDRYRHYAEAVRDAGLLARFGAVKLCGGPALELLEGALDPGETLGVLEFPSLTAARAFWHSADYRDIAQLRAEAGKFRIGLWPKLPLHTSPSSHGV